MLGEKNLNGNRDEELSSTPSFPSAGARELLCTQLIFMTWQNAFKLETTVSCIR